MATAPTYGTFCGGGYPYAGVAGVAGPGCGYGYGGFALIVVLFILLIIIGACCSYNW
ncbi:YjcZ family sporulation protein [Mesobacillus jeotgali]|uniref:YjcZ family sporulation protein n=1 Tax=Mesobacillus jeotgali TaxID=129985 RepID=UPI0009A836C5|nr:YjcZ family sporulation protein [Mesobacillus jeotgali]